MAESLAGAPSLADRAQQILHTACQTVGLDHRGAELLRLRSNAVYKLKDPIIVRIATAPTAAEWLPAVLAVTRWLDQHGFPTVRPTDHITDQPLMCSGVAVTFWDYVPASDLPSTTSELGRLLRDLHAFPTPPIALRRLVDPLASLRANLQQHPDNLTPSERGWLSHHITDLTEQWEQLPFVGPPVLLHGDAWIDNLFRHRDGHVILGDWDSVALGPREWDLIHSHHGQTRFGLNQHDVDAFTTAYGHDLRAWPGYETLQRIRDLYAVSIHIRNAHGDPFSHQELRRRMRSLIEGTTDRWYMKPT
ncbi:aminoglycoside phosphotransferase family protein [Actinomadura logoneensis]|uniref:Aminoglycoside phosphotransferase family protein n=1 Tax=Actinomadura logoneensis TaxID=2293572 RepID=A0A372JK79_9ACTN|nr:aminoglycoside phosphotransferase family protein [Actinomadura logoneensis]RFU40216.1 aminoglycoside phosphotransferase family protein [Actinomadura logoneensis]